jgi:histone H3/H4
MTYFPSKGIQQELKKNGATRVSKQAIVQIQRYLQEQIRQILEQSQRYAIHAKRKTITESDVELAIVVKNK